MFEMGHERDPEEVKHTLWTAYNSVVYFSDYLLPLSGKIPVSDLNDIWQKYEKEDLERRIKRIWFGDAATLKVRAYEKALGYLN